MANTQDKLKQMSDEMQHIMDNAKALVDATSGEMDERIKSTRAALKERLDSAKSESWALKDRLLDQIKDADEYIHVKPYYAIGGTFLAGLFLGWFMSRK